MLLTLALIATTLNASPVRVLASVSAQASGRIVQAARVVDGLSDRPAARGVTTIQDLDGSRQTLRLVEFN